MAGLIKREHVPVTASYSFDDLARRGHAIIAQAEARAAQILAAARNEAQKLLEQERRRGHAEGVQTGRRDGEAAIRRETTEAARREAKQRTDQLLEALRSALASFDEAKRRLIAESEAGIARLALAIARRVCKIEVGRSPDAAAANLRHLLSMIRNEQDLEIHVSIAEYESLRSAAEDALRAFNSSLHCRVVASESVAPGDCELRGRSGTIDASIETQLARIADAIVGPEPAAT